jgi:hypothetical protein
VVLPSHNFVTGLYTMFPCTCARHRDLQAS